MIRFKTLEEMLRDYGDNWRVVVACSWLGADEEPSSNMDRLLGRYIDGIDISFRAYTLSRRSIGNIEELIIAGNTETLDITDELNNSSWCVNGKCLTLEDYAIKCIVNIHQCVREGSFILVGKLAQYVEKVYHNKDMEYFTIITGDKHISFNDFKLIPKKLFNKVK